MSGRCRSKWLVLPDGRKVPFLRPGGGALFVFRAGDKYMSRVTHGDQVDFSDPELVLFRFDPDEFYGSDGLFLDDFLVWGAPPFYMVDDQGCLVADPTSWLRPVHAVREPGFKAPISDVREVGFTCNEDVSNARFWFVNNFDRFSDEEFDFWLEKILGTAKAAYSPTSAIHKWPQFVASTLVRLWGADGSSQVRGVSHRRRVEVTESLIGSLKPFGPDVVYADYAFRTSSMYMVNFMAESCSETYLDSHVDVRLLGAIRELNELLRSGAENFEAEVQQILDLVLRSKATSRVLGGLRRTGCYAGEVVDLFFGLRRCGADDAIRKVLVSDLTVYSPDFVNALCKDFSWFKVWWDEFMVRDPYGLCDPAFLFNLINEIPGHFWSRVPPDEVVSVVSRSHDTSLRKFSVIVRMVHRNPALLERFVEQLGDLPMGDDVTFALNYYLLDHFSKKSGMSVQALSDLAKPVFNSSTAPLTLRKVCSELEKLSVLDFGVPSMKRKAVS